MRLRLQINKRWLKAAAALLPALLALLLFIHYINNNKWREEMSWLRESEENAALLQTKLSALALRYQGKVAEVARLQGGTQNIHGAQEQFYNEIVKELTNKSNGFKFLRPEVYPQPMDGAPTATTMSHLLNQPRASCPGFQVLSPRRYIDVDLVIGIPTVKRDKENYLLETIKSLIDGMTADQRNRSLIVVCIGEVDKIDFIAETSIGLNTQFGDYYGQLIELVSPTEYWYPKWSSIRPSLGDSYKRTVWRSKQNLDAIFLMSYAQSKGTYYLMLEDDVIAKNGFVTEIMKFTASQTIKTPNWAFINFSTTGGIGKLFRSQDLASFNAFVQVFYQAMPIDWLTESFLALRVCGISTGKSCGPLKKTIRPEYNTSLFEHIGLFSSLRGKIQKVKPTLRVGKVAPLFYAHKNPPVSKITLTIKSDSHTIERAYRGVDYFSGANPKAQDTIEFWFDPPVRINMFYFGTGNYLKRSHIIQQSVVEVLPANNSTYNYIEKFDEFGSCEGYVDGDIGPLKSLRIRVLADIKHRIIISEINLKQILPERYVDVESSSTDQPNDRPAL